VQPLCSLCLCG